MIEYQVGKDANNKYHVWGAIDENATPLEIPSDNPYKKQYIDLFLHKADIDRGIQYLKLISEANDTTINEALFIAGLNNCMKCFKRSKSRCKLDKLIVFQNEASTLAEFIKFEELRDKHYDHDENGMVQTTAFLLVSSTEAGTFWGQPSVVWNRIKLDFCEYGQQLCRIMQYIDTYLRTQINSVGSLIMSEYKNISPDTFLNWEHARLLPATETTPRCK